VEFPFARTDGEISVPVRVNRIGTVAFMGFVLRIRIMAGISVGCLGLQSGAD
jgi:hypothetical protein